MKKIIIIIIILALALTGIIYLTLIDKNIKKSEIKPSVIKKSALELKIDSILKSAEKKEDRLSYISSLFLNTNYKSDMMSPAGSNEELIMDIENVDCFTYVDYVTALDMSNNFSDFKKNLTETRYADGKITYAHRNHFFTDWIKQNNYKDVAKIIAPKKAELVVKKLNLKKDGTKFLESPVREISFYYIKSEDFTKDILNNLKNGDLIGNAASADSLYWLDVTHTGIIIKKDGAIFVRHASSTRNKVLDDEITEYLKTVKGLVILRK